MAGGLWLKVKRAIPSSRGGEGVGNQGSVGGIPAGNASAEWPRIQLETILRPFRDSDFHGVDPNEKQAV
jgi:hypothetical protein